MRLSDRHMCFLVLAGVVLSSFTCTAALERAREHSSLTPMDPSIEREAVANLYELICESIDAEYGGSVEYATTVPDRVYFPMLLQNVHDNGIQYRLELSSEIVSTKWSQVLAPVASQRRAATSDARAALEPEQRKTIYLSPIWSDGSRSVYILYFLIVAKGSIEAGEAVVILKDSYSGALQVRRQVAFIT